MRHSEIKKRLGKVLISCPRHGIGVHRVLSCYDQCSCSVHVDCVSHPTEISVATSTTERA